MGLRPSTEEFAIIEIFIDKTKLEPILFSLHDRVKIAVPEADLS